MRNPRPYQFKLLNEHDYDPDNEYDYHQWVDIGPPSTYTLPKYGGGPYQFWLDAIGRRNHGMYRWRMMICNNTECSGRALYRVDTIEQLAQEWDEERTSHG